MGTDESVTQWLAGAAAGSEVAAQKLWERYFEQLVRLARNKLGAFPRRTVDEEDVALSAFDGLVQGVQQGRFPLLKDRDNLWRLLVVITARKASDVKQHARRQKRGAGRTVGESALAGREDDGLLDGLAQVVGREPTPEFAALVAEQYQRLLAQLPDPQTQLLAQLKFEGYTNAEIAARFDVTPRTVERKLHLLRSLLTAEAD